MTAQTIAIVTGASRGLGEALAAGLLQRGTAVITVSRGSSAQLSSLAERSQTSLVQISADLSSADGARQAAADVVTHLPARLTRCLLINNAGTVEPIAPTSRLGDIADIAAAFTLNVSSLILMCAAVLSATDQAGIERRILNISSGAGRNPVPGWGVYCATKAAVDMYTQVLAREQDSVRAVSLAPGIIDTAMQQVIRSTDRRDFPSVEQFVAFHEKGHLASADTTAGQILQYLDRDDFGKTVLDDIRNYF